MKLSIVIPARNEEGCIESTITSLHDTLVAHGILHEILVIDDDSQDNTSKVLSSLSAKIKELKFIKNHPPHGFGFAVRKGLELFQGDAVAIVMADASDLPSDVVNFFKTLTEKNVDCVFGTRFHPSAKVYDYPKFKLILNRIANQFIKILFGIRYNDVTNAFKMYKKEVIVGLKPFLSQHFNLTVELPLKAIVRGYRFEIVSNSWINRKQGQSKLKIREMGSRYLFIILYCFIEKWLSRGDYHKDHLGSFTE